MSVTNSHIANFRCETVRCQSFSWIITVICQDSLMTHKRKVRFEKKARPAQSVEEDVRAGDLLARSWEQLFVQHSDKRPSQLHARWWQ